MSAAQKQFQVSMKIVYRISYLLIDQSRKQRATNTVYRNITEILRWLSRQCQNILFLNLLFTNTEVNKKVQHAHASHPSFGHSWNFLLKVLKIIFNKSHSSRINSLKNLTVLSLNLYDKKKKKKTLVIIAIRSYTYKLGTPVMGDFTYCDLMFV